MQEIQHYKIVKSKADKAIQRNITKLGDRATKWQTKFHVNTCKIMCTGKHINYTIKQWGIN